MAVLILFICGFVTGWKLWPGRTEEEVQEEETIVLTLFAENPSHYIGLQEDPVAAYIEEKFGIRIALTADNTMLREESYKDTYKELLRLKLQSNDFDDIMEFGTALEDAQLKVMLQKAAESGRLLALDDLIANYASTISDDQRMKVRNDYRKENLYTDGKLYSLGSQGGVSSTALPENSVWIRWDLYAKMGYPEVASDEELLQMLSQMQKENGYTLKGEKVFALGMAGGSFSSRGKEIITDYPMTKGYEPIDGMCSAYFNHGDMTVSCPVLDPESFFWNGVRFYFEANQRGLLDEESDSMDISAYTRKINRGIYLAGLDGSQLQNKESILAGQGLEKSGYMPMSPLADTAAVFRYHENVLGTSDIAVSSTCKYPEKVMEFLDWCFSEEGSRILQQGASGLAWNVENGSYTLTDEYKKDATLGIVDMEEKYGKQKYSVLSGFGAGSLDKEMHCIQIEQELGVKEESALQKDARERFDSGNLPDIAWSAYFKCIGERPSWVYEQAEAINDYVKNTIMECVFASDDREFMQKKEEIMETAMTMGIQKVADWYSVCIEDFCKKNMPVIDETLHFYID